MHAVPETRYAKSGDLHIAYQLLGDGPDLVLVDLTHPMMQPTREPLRSLIYSAAERAVRNVFIAGRQVVKDGRVSTMDYAAAAAGVNESQKRALAKVSSLDWAGRTVDELAPPSFRLRRLERAVSRSIAWLNAFPEFSPQR